MPASTCALTCGALRRSPRCGPFPLTRQLPMLRMVVVPLRKAPSRRASLPRPMSFRSMSTARSGMPLAVSDSPPVTDIRAHLLQHFCEFNVALGAPGRAEHAYRTAEDSRPVPGRR